jgi:hypothetical protein
MKLAKGSQLRITNFELEATWELQTSSLSSKLSVQDDIVWETLYVCNQNFDQRFFFQVCCMLGRYVEGLEFPPKKIIRCRRYLFRGA